MKHTFGICLLLVSTAPVYAEWPNPKDLVSQSLGNYERSLRAGMQWGYTQQDATWKDGKQAIETSEVFPLEGTPYERLTRRDGQPLSASEEQKEERKFERERRSRMSETPAERELRIGKYEKQRAFMKEIPDAYDFKLVGSEDVGGRPAWVVTMTPRVGFVPTAPHAEMLKHIDGKLWIDKQDLQWARADAHVIDTISVGVILARIGPGAHITIDLNKVAPDIWLPSRMSINGAAKVLLLGNRNLEEQLTFMGYHRGESAVAGNRATR